MERPTKRKISEPSAPYKTKKVSLQRAVIRSTEQNDVILYTPVWMNKLEERIQDFDREVLLEKIIRRDGLTFYKGKDMVGSKEYLYDVNEFYYIGVKGITTVISYTLFKFYPGRVVSFLAKFIGEDGIVLSHPFKTIGLIRTNEEYGEQDNTGYEDWEESLLWTIRELLESWKHKGITDYDYSLGKILRIQIIVFDVNVIGYCNSNTTEKAMFGMKVRSVQSTQGECLINSLCNIRKKSNRAHVISRSIRFEFPEIGEIGDGIDIKHIDKLARYFELNIRIIDENRMELAKYVVDENCMMNTFVYHDKHYYILVRERLDPIICSNCGKAYKKNHVCNIKKCEICGATYSRSHNSCDVSKRKYLYNLSREKEDKGRLNPKFIASRTPWEKGAIIFDIETFPDPLTGRHNAYAIGFIDCGLNIMEGYKFEYYWGKNAISDFIDYVVNRKVQKKFTLIGFNNFSFDNNFILQEVLKKKIKVTGLGLQNGSIINLETEHFRCRDIYKFLPGMSLAKASKEFGANMDIAKDKFPHFFIKSWYDLSYVGKIPEAKYYPNNDGVEYDGDDWNLKDECLKYLERDVRSTLFVCSKIGDIVRSSFGLCWTDFVTVSQMGYEFWANTISRRNKLQKPLPLESFKTDYYVEIPKDPRKLELLRSAVYGGWVMPIKKWYECDNYDEIINGNIKHDQVDDYLMALDIVSMYATCMRDELYPEGVSEWATDCISLTEILMDCNFSEFPMGVYEVDYYPNKNLIIPVLPWKEFKSTKVDGIVKSSGEMVWDLNDRRGVYTSVDLITARKAGYKINIRQGLFWRNKKHIFKDYIGFTEEIKTQGTEEGNNAKRSFGKITGNSVYGKQMQRIFLDEHEVYEDGSDISKMEKEGYSIVDIIMMEQHMICKREKDSIAGIIPKPIQNAAFILSYSRAMRDYYTKIIDPYFASENVYSSFINSVYYGDTDSFYVQMKPDTKERIEPHLQKGVFGKLWNDYDNDAKIIKAFFLAPKTYAVQTIDKNNKIEWKMKCKGIPRKDIKLEYFIDMYEENKEAKVHMKDRLMKTGTKKGKKNHMDVDPFGVYSYDMERTLGHKQYEGRVFNECGDSHPHGFVYNSLEEMIDLTFSEHDLQ